MKEEEMPQADNLEDELFSAAEQVAVQAREVKETLRTLDQRVVKFVRQRPTTCVLVALATGFALGRMGRSRARYAAPSATQSIVKAGLTAVLRAAAIAIVNNRIAAMTQSIG